MIEKLKLLKNRYIIAVLILFAFCLRLYTIDYRPIHHDESLHAHYSYAQQQNFPERHYKYNPMLHGPLLYDITSVFIIFFGNSKHVWRFPPLLFGVGVVALFLLIFRRSSRQHLLIFGIFVVFSPTLIYWSRFLRNDIIVVFFQLTLFLLFIAKNSRAKSLLTLPVVTTLFCLKENAYLTFTQLFLISIPYIIIYRPKFNKEYLKEILISVFISIFIYIALYSSFFYYPDGILDGLYRKSLLYWFEQHSTSRIDGPFSFQLLNLLMYSPLFVAASLMTIAHILVKQGRRIIFFSGSLLTIAVLLFLFEWPRVSFFKIPLDHATFFILLTIQFIPIIFLKQKKNTMYFISSFFLSSLLLYSYVGEKVPWLSIYPYSAGLLFLFYYWKDVVLKSITTVVLACIIISISMTLNYSVNYTYSPNEFIHQVGSTPELEERINLVSPGAKVLVKGDVVWPIHIFFENYPNYRFHSNSITNLSSFEIIFLDSKNYNKLKSSLVPNFTVHEVPFRRYWWPRNKDYTVSSAIKYLFTRQPSSKLSVDNFYYLQSKK